MDGDLDDKAAQGEAGEGDSGEQALAEGHEDAQADDGAEGQGRPDRRAPGQSRERR